MRLEKASYVMLVAFLILFALDLYSTLRIGEIVKYLEMNPLFEFGGFPLIIALNFVVLYFFLRLYDTDKQLRRYTTLAIFVLFSFLRVAIIFNNFAVGEMVITEQITIEDVKHITQEEKNEVYQEQVLGFITVPLIAPLLIYFLYTLDNVIRRKKKSQK